MRLDLTREQTSVTFPENSTNGPPDYFQQLLVVGRTILDLALDQIEQYRNDAVAPALADQPPSRLCRREASITRRRDQSPFR